MPLGRVDYSDDPILDIGAFELVFYHAIAQDNG